MCVWHCNKISRQFTMLTTALIARVFSARHHAQLYFRPAAVADHPHSALIPRVEQALKGYYDRSEVDGRRPRLRVERREGEAQVRVDLKPPRSRKQPDVGRLVRVFSGQKYLAVIPPALENGILGPAHRKVYFVQVSRRVEPDVLVRILNGVLQLSGYNLRVVHGYSKKWLRSGANLRNVF